MDDGPAGQHTDHRNHSGVLIMKKTDISDPALVDALCLIQQDFVKKWNAAEMNQGIGQTHDLPNGAKYSGGKSPRAASFVLSDGTWIDIIGKAPWHHWHDGWSYCRHPITRDQVRKVTVRGSIDAFNEWIIAVQCINFSTNQH
jgi:hypothetical protein